MSPGILQIGYTVITHQRIARRHEYITGDVFSDLHIQCLRSFHLHFHVEPSVGPDFDQRIRLEFNL